MRKQNDGYVMIYVLVVVLLLGLVAAGVLSISLNNFRAQDALGEQMQELYTTEGAVEQAISTIESLTGELTTPFTGTSEETTENMNINEYFSDEYESSVEIATATRFAQKVIDQLTNDERLKDQLKKVTLLIPEEYSGNPSDFVKSCMTGSSCTLPYGIVLQSGNTVINIRLNVVFMLATKLETSEETEDNKAIITCSVVNVKSKVLSYEISTGGEAA